ncbi:hypothetical protein Taro_007016 [Colocasia esculenta]|uniref:Myb-like domain-containing protein n=1 Tax=Colocasia esculenta TaxID=4460 RepID=A0A843TZ95_COLES|nr:hypothetical protein [Colocasia esculenta]
MTVEGGGGVGGYPAEHPQQQLQQQRSAVQPLALGMALPDYGGPLTPSAVVPAAANANSSTEDPSKKIRKPYTITKSRESWTEQEHDKFLEALQLYAPSRSSFVSSCVFPVYLVPCVGWFRIRSHAQKYFLKVQKNGTSEHVPPPRPKRKAAHPYPQKASKNGLKLS